MFGSFNNAVSAYKSVGVDTAITSADPHKLILLLFDGSVAALAIARGAMRDQRIADKGAAISKAIDIITNGLKASLDVEHGGELAAQLGGLYDYMAVRLLHANLKNDAAALDEVSALLVEIQGAWAEIRKAALANEAPPEAAA
jgi:flagellar protein FliS